MRQMFRVMADRDRGTPLECVLLRRLQPKQDWNTDTRARSERTFD